jgi:DNA-binding NarL/FixJ family response regulator
MISFIIADDHKIFRQGLKLTLLDDEALNCIGEAGDGAELIELLKTQLPDVILLDLKMPRMDGLEAIKIIREKNDEVKIIVLSMFEDEQFVLHMMESGANGYLLKNAEPQEIKAALHSVIDKGHYFNDLVNNTFLRKIIHQKKGLTFKDEVKLNDKEIEILQLICQEFTTAEIAQKVFLSTRTIEGIRSSLLEKIGVRNTAGLVMYAVRHGVVD